MANALEILAKEYEAEESQTLTTALDSEFSRFKPLDNNSQGSDDSDNEDTVIEEYEETIIQNNDTYIDKLISDKRGNSAPRYSESTTMTISPNFAISPANVHQQSSHGFGITQNIIGGKSPKGGHIPPLQPQMSQDFLLIVENLQKELHQKDKALEIIAKQLKQKQSDHDKMVNKNEALNKQIKQLQTLQKESNDNKSTDLEIESIQSQLIEKSQTIIDQNDRIDKLNDNIKAQNIMNQSLTKEIDAYQNIAEWLEMQMKWESNGSVTSRQNSNALDGKQTPRPKLTVKALEEWKFSIISNQQKGFSVDSEKMMNNDNYINEDEEKQIEEQPTPKGYDTISDKDKKSEEQEDQDEDGDGNGDEYEQDPKDYNEETALLSGDDGGDGKAKSKKKKKKKKDKRKLRTQLNGEAENAINADTAGCCIPWFNQGQ